MLNHSFIFKVISKMPEIIMAKQYDYQALEDNENIYIYRIPFMEEKELYITIPKATSKIRTTYTFHIPDGNQYYDKYGTPKAGGSNGRYPGCGIGNWKGSLNNPYVQKIRKQNILFLC